MIEKTHVRPKLSSIRDAKGERILTRVHDRQRRQIMGAKGYSVPLDKYWRRLIKFGAVEIVEKSTPEESKRSRAK